MTSYKIALDTKRCAGYANCLPILPEVFKLEKGAKVAELLQDTVDEDLLDDLKAAVRNCPARAISFSKIDG